MKKLIILLSAIAAACVPPTPVTPRPPGPTAPTSFALTVVVTEAESGKPLQAEVYTDNVSQAWRERTNRAGFARHDGFTAAAWNLCATAADHATACEPIAEPTSRVIVFKLSTTDPKRPASGRLPLRASFGTHSSSLGDKRAPIFDVFWMGMPPEWRAAVAKDKRARGLTHILFSRCWGYEPYERLTGFTSGCVTADVFQQGITEAYERGLWALVWLPFDDDAKGEASVYDGRMEAELRGLLPVLDKAAAVSICWECVGTWRAKAIADAGALARRILGPDALLILHGRDNERFTASSYWGECDLGASLAPNRECKPDPRFPGKGSVIEADDPSHGDEAGWWLMPGADEFDIFAFEARHGRDGPSFSNGNPDTNGGTWLGRLLEGWYRFAPPDTFVPALGKTIADIRRERQIPDWFAGRRKRGRPILSPFELEEVEAVYGGIPDSRIDDVADLLASYGFEHFGSGIPRPLQVAH